MGVQITKFYVYMSDVHNCLATTESVRWILWFHKSIEKNICSENWRHACISIKFHSLQSLHPEDGGSKVLRNIGILPCHITRRDNPEDYDLI
jgi:hypothetical protein